MKKGFIATSIVLCGLSFQQASAQISVNINIGSQPAWGPTGYDYVQYYYLPDINCYYDVARSQYIYPQGNHWGFASRLPGKYRNYDIYNSYKVVVNRANPYRDNRTDITAYGRYKGQRGQEIIRDSRDKKYFVNRGNKYYGHDNQGDDHGRGHGRGRGHDRDDH